MCFMENIGADKSGDAGSDDGNLLYTTKFRLRPYVRIVWNKHNIPVEEDQWHQKSRNSGVELAI
jgi:hypothetical protein